MFTSHRSRWHPLLAVGLVLAWAVSAPAQATTPGSIRFANLGPGVDAPFFNTNGLRLLGSNFVAALYLAPSNSGPFVQISGLQRFVQAPGYWTPSTETTRQFPAGTRVRVQVRFWDESRFPTNSSFLVAEALGAAIGVAEIPALDLNEDGSPTPLFELQSANLIPTLTLSLGGTRVAYDPATAASGSQLPTLCDVPVGTNRWFRLTSPVAGHAALNTDGSLFDTVLAVFRGSIVNLAGLEPIACNDDRAPGRLTSALQVAVAADELFLVCVAGKNGAGGPVQLNYATGVILELRPVLPSLFELSWPAGRGRYQLETSTKSGGSPSWQTVDEPPFLIENRYVLPWTGQNPQQYFRLRALP